jgi:hypothetical protein
MPDRNSFDLDDEIVRSALRRVAEAVQQNDAHVPIPDLATLEREKTKRARAKALLVSGLAVTLVVLGVIIGVHVSNGPSTQSVTSPPPHVELHERPVLAVSPEVNLDILGTLKPVSVNLASGTIETTPPIVTSAAQGARIAYGLQRSGFILGVSVDGDTTVSVSENLQRLIHVWNSLQGTYPAPAANPADVWLSREFANPPQAQEFNEYESPVGPAVPIPRGSLVFGQLGSDLVVVTPADPLELLELWDPSRQEVLVAFGTFDQMATTPTSLAWTSGDVLHVYTPGQAAQITSDGPSGDWATALAAPADGSSIAVVWQPAPGSPDATSWSRIYAHSTLSLVNTSTGVSTTVPDSSGSVGPIAWSTDGSRIFFGQSTGAATPVVISTYLIGASASRKLKIPTVSLPSDFGPTNGSLIVWDDSLP